MCEQLTQPKRFHLLVFRCPSNKSPMLHSEIGILQIKYSEYPKIYIGKNYSVLGDGCDQQTWD